jgi:hemolysin III
MPFEDRGAAVEPLPWVRPRFRGSLHVAAFLLSPIAGLILVLEASFWRARIAMMIYAVSLTACLGVSAAYHRGPWRGRVRYWLGRVDRVTIFAFIAGTYTPLAVVALWGAVGITTLAVIWSCAAIGAVITTRWPDTPGWLEATIFLSINIIAIVAVPFLVPHIGWTGLILLLAGGAAYVAGAMIYARERPDPWPLSFGFHEIFHTLVVVAIVAHYALIAGVVLPRA